MIGLPAPVDGVVTWRMLLHHAERLLADHGLASPGVDARCIIEDASGCAGAELLAELDRGVPTAGAAAFQRMVTRRVGGEPLQYVLGRWAFRTLDLAVDRRVLIPRPETEVVAGIALEELAWIEAARDPDGGDGDRDPDLPGLVAADLGTGSGAIGLSLAAEHPSVAVWLTDRSPDALAVATANLAGIGLGATRVRVAEGSWFDALPGPLHGHVDLAVSNPPYIADGEILPDEVAVWEPRGALRAGERGTECYEEILADAPGWLARPGALVLEIAPAQCAAVEALAIAAGAEVRHGADLTGRVRWVAARWVRAG